jgi:hypothetical protein
MSDLRNFGSSNEPVIISEKIPETNFGAPAQFRDTGGLSNFHHPVEEEETNSNTARMIGAAVVVVMLCGAGAYAYMSSSATPKSPVATSSLPAPSAPQQTADNTPPPAPAMQTAPSAPPSGKDALANSPYGSAPVGKMDKSAPVATPASAPEDTTIVKHRVKTARADKKEVVEDKQEAQTTNSLNSQEATSVTQQNTATAAATPAASASNDVASTTPLPTPPSAPASSVASNGQINGQGAATSAPQALSPAPTETPAQPAPATPAPDTSSQQQPSQAQPAQAQPQ